MPEIRFSVDGFPPAKNEAKSMLAAGHIYADRVLRLLAVVEEALGDHSSRPLFPQERLGLELILNAPEPPPADATNYLGGVGDVLESKARRGLLDHLGTLAAVAVYENDRQIDEVHYHYEPGSVTSYSVRIWTLNT